MKLGNIILIVFTSILTFIALLITKLYEKYVKKNILVQSALYIFWTALIFRIMYWAIKLIVHIHSLSYFKTIIHTCGTYITEPLIVLILVIVICASILYVGAQVLRRL